jgi:hypothetical protein
MALISRVLIWRPRVAMSLCQKALMSSHGYQTPLPWNYIWKPGPYPRSQEQRDAAAKKVIKVIFQPLRLNLKKIQNKNYLATNCALLVFYFADSPCKFKGRIKINLTMTRVLTSYFKSNNRTMDQ